MNHCSMCGADEGMFHKQGCVREFANRLDPSKAAPDGIRHQTEKTAMSPFMRAKMQVNKIERGVGVDRITCNAVAAKAYPADGSDEDNTYAKFSPSGELVLAIANPALLGMIEPGQKFYLDFTKAD